MVDTRGAVVGVQVQTVGGQAGQIGFAVHQWIVERTITWLSRHRHLAKDVERFPEITEAFIYIVMAQLLLKRLDP